MRTLEPAQAVAQAVPMAGNFSMYSFVEFNEPAIQQAPLYTPQPMPGGRKNNSLGIIFLSISLVLVLLGAGLGAFAYFYIATHTSSQQASVRPTPVASPTPSPMQLYTQATSGTPDINDPLDGSTFSLWRDYSSTTGSCAFQDGAYHVMDITPGHYTYCYPGYHNHTADFAFQVQMKLLKGANEGIIFRADPTTHNYYYINFSQNGDYIVSLHQSNSSLEWTMLTGGEAASFRSGSNQPNVVTVLAQGSHFYFYVNEQFVTQATDTTLVSGTVGLVADDHITPTEVAFNNAKLWILNS